MNIIFLYKIYKGKYVLPKHVWKNFEKNLGSLQMIEIGT